jgi:hypothetical protein
MAVIYQNRAAANERLENLEEALKDLESSVGLNNRYNGFPYNLCLALVPVSVKDPVPTHV